MKKIIAALALLAASLPAAADPVSFVAAIVAEIGAMTQMYMVMVYAAEIASFLLTVGTLAYGTSRARRMQQRAAASAKAAYNASLQDRNITALRVVPPRRHIIGRPGQVGGDIVALFHSDKTESGLLGSPVTKPDGLAHMVIVFACHQCSAINEIYIDGTAVGALDGNGWATTGRFTSSPSEARTVTFTTTTTVSEAITSVLRCEENLGGDNGFGSVEYTLSNGDKTITVANGKTVTVEYTVAPVKSHVKVSKHLGTASQTVDTYLNSVVPSQWTSDHRLRGLTYIVLTLDLEFHDFQSGPPQITADISGKLLYDPRTGNTLLSNNSALALFDFLCDDDGFGVDRTRDINLPLANAAANACEVNISLTKMVDGSPVTVTEPKYTTNGVWTTDDDRESILAALADAMAGECVYGADWMMTAGVWTASVMDLGDNDLAGQIDIVQAGASVQESFNSVRMSYIDAGAAAPTDVNPPYQNATFIAADGEERWQDRVYLFTNHPTRCANLARIDVEAARSSLIISFPAKLKGLPLQFGDRVRVTSAEYGFSNKYFRVTDYGFSLASPVILVLQEDDSTIYDLADAAIADPTPNTALPDPHAVAAPENLSITSSAVRSGGAGTVYTTKVEVSWDFPASAYVADGGQVELRWRYAGTTAYSTQIEAGNVTKATLAAVRAGWTIVVEVRFINSTGRKSPWAIGAHTTASIAALTLAELGYSGALDATLGAILNNDRYCKVASAWDAYGATADPVMLTGVAGIPNGTAVANTTGSQTDLIATQLIPVQATRRYRLSMKAFTAQGSPPVYLGVAWYTASDVLIVSSDVNPAGWTNGTFSYFGLLEQVPFATPRDYSIEFGAGAAAAIPASAAKAKIVALLNFGSVIGSRAAICDVRFEDISADVNTERGSFSSAMGWDFVSSALNWTIDGDASISVSGGAMTVTSSGTDPIIQSPSGLTVDGSKYYRVRARVMRTAGNDWQGTCYYEASGHSFSESYKKDIPDTTAIGEWVVLEWDMSALTAGGSDWTSKTITRIRLDLGNSAADAFKIDYIAIGTHVPGTYGATWGIDVYGTDDVDAAVARVDKIVSDSWLTANEKPALEREWIAINGDGGSNPGEYTALHNQGTGLGLTALAGAYQTAKNALGTYLGTLTGWNDPNAADNEVVASTFKTKWLDYYAAKAALQRGIEDELETRANYASAWVDDITDQNLITPDEKPRLDREWSVISSEWEGIRDLGTARGLTALTSAFTTAKGDLGTYLGGLSPQWNDATAGSTPIVVSTFKSKWNAYYAAREALIAAIEGNIASVADAASAWVADIISDSKITPDEKPRIVREYDLIVSEYTPLYNRGTERGLTTLRDDYELKRGQLDTYLAGLTTPYAWNVLTGNTTINASDFATKWKNYYIARESLVRAIEGNIATVADGASAWVADIISDAKITPDEKPRLVREYELIQSEYVGLQNRADDYGLSALKSDFETKRGNLDTYLAGLTTPYAWHVLTGNTTIVAADFKAAWKNYYTSKEALVRGIEGAAKTALDKIADIASDTKITDDEKPRLVRDWQAIVGADGSGGEYPGIYSQGTTFGETALRDAYETAKNALSTYLGTLTGWNVVNGTAVTIVAATFASKWYDYYAAREALLRAIEAKARTLANQGISDADAQKQRVDAMLSDSTITLDEKPSLAREWKAIYDEYSGIQARGTAYGLTILRTTYVNAYNALDTYLHTTLVPPADSGTENTTVDAAVFKAKWTDYYAARAALLDGIYDEAAKRANRLDVTDTRNDNTPPSGYTIGNTREFKDVDAIGITKENGQEYCVVETTKGWSDASGGYAVQYAYYAGKTYRRYGFNDASSWGSWVLDITRADYTGDMDATRDLTLVNVAPNYGLAGDDGPYGTHFVATSTTTRVLVKSTLGSGNFAVDGISMKRRYDDGTYGDEMITNGTFSSNVNNWSVSGSATLSWDNINARAYVNASAADGGMYQDVTTVVGHKYYLKSDWIDRGTAAEVVITTNNGHGYSPFISISGNSVACSAVLSWMGAVVSKEGYVGGAFVSFSPNQTNAAFMVGLAKQADLVAPYYTNIDFAIYVVDNGTVVAYRDGGALSHSTTYYAVGDVLSIQYDGYKVQYLVNQTVFHTVTVGAISDALFLDSSFRDILGVSRLRFGPMSAVSGIVDAQVDNLDVNTLLAGVDFVPYLAWDFIDSTLSWTSSGTSTFSASGGKLTITSSGVDPTMSSPSGLSIAGSKYNKVRARVKRTAGSGWDGSLYYSVSGGHSFDGNYWFRPSNMSNIPNDGKWYIVEWDTAVSQSLYHDWNTSTITQIRLDFGASNGDSFDVDWVAVGRHGPIFLDSGNVNMLMDAGTITSVYSAVGSSDVTISNAAHTPDGFSWNTEVASYTVPAQKFDVDVVVTFEGVIEYTNSTGSTANASYSVQDYDGSWNGWNKLHFDVAASASGYKGSIKTERKFSMSAGSTRKFGAYVNKLNSGDTVYVRNYELKIEVIKR